MEAAKETISKLLGSHGHHKTEVDEQVAPAVTSETVKPHRHEETTQAIDKEVHQDHYHTTVQPLQHQEVLPEEHKHNILPTQEKTIQHGSPDQDRERVSAELGQFKDTSTVNPTTTSTEAAPTVTGEHVHHHVHETVQPVVHKETIQPEVVHTTVPIHETHHAPSEHHGMTVLPTTTLDEFKGLGGKTAGGIHESEEYEGHPKPYDSRFQTEQKPVDLDPRAHDGTHDLASTGHTESTGAAGVAAPAAASSSHNRFDSGVGLLGHDRTREQETKPSHSGLGAGAAGVGAGALAGATAAHSLHNNHGTDSSASRDLYDEQAARGPTEYSTGHEGFGAPQTTDATNATPSTGLTSTEPTTASSHSHGNPAAMGAGVAGVGAGAVAADLAKDHVRAGDNKDLTPHDTTGTVGTSGSDLAGTSLGGRTDGNTVPTASEHATRDTLGGAGVGAAAASALPTRETAHGYHTTASADPMGGKTQHGYDTGAQHYSHTPSSTHDHSTGGTAAAGAGAAAATAAAAEHHHTKENEPSPAAAQPSTSDAKAEPTNFDESSAPKDDNVQHASQLGKDPNLVDENLKGGKLTGTGVDGSHSAVFGLTPDGHKHDDTKHGQHMEHEGGGKAMKETLEQKEEEGQERAAEGEVDTGSRGAAGAGVAEQLNDPRAAEKGHDGQASYDGSDTKPGAGVPSTV